MKHGGILFVDVPNRHRFTINRSLTKGEFPEGDYPPHHLTFWSMASLSKALEIADYSILECRPRAFGSEGQVEAFLVNRFNISASRLASLPATGLRVAGRILGLQGDTLYGIARR